MPLAVLALVLEIVASVLLVNFPAPMPLKNSKTLGESTFLAQDETPPPDQTPPADQTTPLPDTTTATEPASAPADITNTLPAETSPLPADTTTQTPTTTTETSPTQTASPQPESSPAATSPTTETSPTSSPEANTTSQETPEQGASTSANLPILNTDELINNPSQIDSSSQAEVAKEQQQLDQITDPTLKAAALTTFASDKISDIDHFTKSEDFNSTIFASQRFSDQIDQLKNLSTQTATDQAIRQKLSDVCQQANTILRTTQEIVPEELEQDLEINRGQCLGY